MERSRPGSVALVLCLAAGLAGVVGGGGLPAAAAAPLPVDRLHFGLANGPGDLGWMTATGGWRYRYQYLAGGVNTANPWQTWQDPAQPPGQFVVDYSRASAAHGYVPVFTYYELLQSSPSTGSSESDRDWSNLHDTATMRAYYSDVVVLMKRLGEYGGAAVVHVEPDLWGYLQQRAAGAAAGSLSAVVGSSGVADVAGIPDTVAGFADALLHLRDRYAPNVTMAIHASMWGSGEDVATSTDPSLDATAAAGSTAAFLDSAGITSNAYGSTWDLVFHDVDDPDAGWWEAQGADNAGFTHWWDPANHRLPDSPAGWSGWPPCTPAPGDRRSPGRSRSATSST